MARPVRPVPSKTLLSPVLGTPQSSSLQPGPGLTLTLDPGWLGPIQTRTIVRNKSESREGVPDCEQCLQGADGWGWAVWWVWAGSRHGPGPGQARLGISGNTHVKPCSFLTSADHLHRDILSPWLGQSWEKCYSVVWKWSNVNYLWRKRLLNSKHFHCFNLVNVDGECGFFSDDCLLPKSCLACQQWNKNAMPFHVVWRNKHLKFGGKIPCQWLNADNIWEK